MKLKLHDPQPGDKRLLITEESESLQVEQALRMFVDYDDVDHDRVLKAARELVRKVNSA